MEYVLEDSHWVREAYIWSNRNNSGGGFSAATITSDNSRLGLSLRGRGQHIQTKTTALLLTLSLHWAGFFFFFFSGPGAQMKTTFPFCGLDHFNAQVRRSELNTDACVFSANVFVEKIVLRQMGIALGKLLKTMWLRVYYMVESMKVNVCM